MRIEGQRKSLMKQMAKVRLDNMDVLEVTTFTERDVVLILEIVARYQSDWMEVWNEIFKNR